MDDLYCVEMLSYLLNLFEITEYSLTPVMCHTMDEDTRGKHDGKDCRRGCCWLSSVCAIWLIRRCVFQLHCGDYFIYRTDDYTHLFKVTLFTVIVVWMRPRVCRLLCLFWWEAFVLLNHFPFGSNASSWLLSVWIKYVLTSQIHILVLSLNPIFLMD